MEQKAITLSGRERDRLNLERYGRPVELYTDKDSMFTVNRPVRRQKDEVEEEEWTQIGRALRELESGWIPAHSRLSTANSAVISLRAEETNGEVR